MNTHRTVAWLVIFMIITPFLSIPEWLLQTIITIFGLVVVGVVLHKSDSERSSPKESPPSNSYGSDNKPSSDIQSDNTSDSNKGSQDPQQSLDIEDPDADTMVAADRWRRRASRDIS